MAKATTKLLNLEINLSEKQKIYMGSRNRTDFWVEENIQSLSYICQIDQLHHLVTINSSKTRQ